MIWLHLSLSALYISLRDIQFHRIKRRDIYFASVTLIPFANSRSFIFAAIHFLIYFALFRLSGKSIGYGDVRLAGLIGLYCGIFCSGPIALIKINLITWLVAGSVVIFHSLKRVNIAQERIAFAPFMFLGLVVNVIADKIEKVSAILG